MEFLGQSPSPEDVEDMIAEVDLDGDGLINCITRPAPPSNRNVHLGPFLIPPFDVRLRARAVEDFAACMVHGMDEVPEEDIAKAFCAFDVNGTGFIAADDLVRMMASVGEDVSISEAKDMVCSSAFVPARLLACVRRALGSTALYRLRHIRHPAPRASDSRG